MQFYAHKDGKRTNSGLAATEPWPISYALAGADGKIPPGSTLHVNIVNVSPYELFPRDDIHGPKTPQVGFKVSLSGLPSKKTTIIFSGRGIGSLPEYRGQMGLTAWKPLSISPGMNIWEGNHVIQPVASIVGGYFKGTDGNTYPLTFGRHNNPASIKATSHIYNSAGDYYTGPTVMQQASGKPIIRLDHASAEAMLGKETIGPTSLNPNECELNLFIFHGYYLNVTGSNLIIDRFNVDFVYIGVLLNPSAHNVTIRKGEIRGGINLINCGVAKNWTIDNMILDGLMDPVKGHISWGDVKAGKQPADSNKCTCLNPGSGTGGKVMRCSLRNAFDGMVGGGAQMQVGGFAKYSPDMTVADWDNACRKLGNHFDRIWDDAHQIDHRQRNLIHNHNLYTGAGISRDGSAESTDYGAGRPLSLCNVFDGSKYKLFLYRKGRDATNPGQTGEGLRHPNTLATHGGIEIPSPNRVRVRPFPWIKVNDTELWGDDCVRSDQAKGLHGADGTLPQAEANEEYNCIVIDKGVYNPTRNNYFRVWSDFVLESSSGLQIRDGNLVVNLAGPKFYQSRIRSREQGMLNPVRTVEELRRSIFFTESQLYYSPGIDKNTDEIDVKSINDVINPNSYVPYHPKAMSGAVNLTARGFPGCFLHRPWRGAIPPAL